MAFAFIDDQDDFDFIFMVRAVVMNLAARAPVRVVSLVKIDNWFAPKWCGFSGKALGAVACRRRPLRVPPFVPARVRVQLTFRASDLKLAPLHLLHIWMDSESHMRRKFTEVVPDTAVIWFSGATVPNGRGAVMTYVRERVDPYGWYAGWLKKDTWLPTQLRGISLNELRTLCSLSPPAVTTPYPQPWTIEP